MLVRTDENAGMMGKDGPMRSREKEAATLMRGQDKSGAKHVTLTTARLCREAERERERERERETPHEPGGYRST